MEKLRFSSVADFREGGGNDLNKWCGRDWTRTNDFTDVTLRTRQQYS
jgi:hypothetical protein